YPAYRQQRQFRPRPGAFFANPRCELEDLYYDATGTLRDQMRAWASIAMAAAAFCASACTSGGGVSCSNAGGTQLAATTWPKFRADAANTGRADVDLNQSNGNGTLV